MPDADGDRCPSRAVRQRTHCGTGAPSSQTDCPSKPPAERTFGRAFRTQKQRSSCMRVVGIYRHIPYRKRQPRPRTLGCDSAMPPPARGNVLQGRSRPLPDLPLTFHTQAVWNPVFRRPFDCLRSSMSKQTGNNNAKAVWHDVTTQAIRFWIRYNLRLILFSNAFV